MQIYSTRSETKAVFAERTKLSLKTEWTLPLLLRLWIQILSQKVSIRHNSDFQNKTARLTWYQNLSVWSNVKKGGRLKPECASNIVRILPFKIEHMEYQIFSNRQFRPLLKNYFHRFHIDFSDTSGKKKYAFHLSASLFLFWCIKKPPEFISNLDDVTRWLLQDKERFHSVEVLLDNVNGVRYTFKRYWEKRNTSSA